jgi:hypothetical protein
MNSHYHSVIAAKRHGGVPEDYYDIDSFIDSSKSAFGDVRHRAILHSTFGCYICEQVFGPTITNSEGKKIPVRLLAEEHIVDDLGFLPTPEHWLGEMPIYKWMSGTVKKTKQEPKAITVEKEELPGGKGAEYKKNLRTKD